MNVPSNLPPYQNGGGIVLSSKETKRLSVNRSSIPPLVSQSESFEINLPKRNIMEEDTFIVETPVADRKQSPLTDSQEETQIDLDKIDVTEDLDSFLIKEKFSSKLSQSIAKSYNELIRIALTVNDRTDKKISREGEEISVRDLIAYQIGWGKRLIAWYEDGKRGQQVEIPGGGFNRWDYRQIAKKFYKDYQYDYELLQFEEFRFTVKKILEIVENENRNNRLDTLNAWKWCATQFDGKWSLAKWIDEFTRKHYEEANGFIKRYPSYVN